MSGQPLGTTNLKLDLQSEARRAVLRADPTEAPRLVLLAVDGPSQFLMGFLGPVGLLLMKSYFLTVTERSVYVHRGPRVRNRPEELVHVIPREQADGLVARVRRGRAWNALYLRLPGGAKPTRLNVSFHSRPELEDFLKKFPAPAA
ncbi:hypothetical protein [Kitasatospora fiedleri]|uniref:hypothetical protein n=1 Tax=Kitasatospora fiedleri TaxID=2991545 RepID=UPI00249B3AF0|nr:hypothetical protein [Kitasatospora fiedleri]